MSKHNTSKDRPKACWLPAERYKVLHESRLGHDHSFTGETGDELNDNELSGCRAECTTYCAEELQDTDRDYKVLRPKCINKERNKKGSKETLHRIDSCCDGDDVLSLKGVND